VTRKDRLQGLTIGKAAPDEPRIAKHHREQPHDLDLVGLVAEAYLELRKINLRLMARRRLEAHCEPTPAARWSQLSHNITHDTVAAFITTVGDFSHQALCGKAGIGLKSLLQIIDMAVDQTLPGLSRPVRWKTNILCKIFSDGLAVHTQLAGNHSDFQSLTMQIHNHK